MIDKALLTSYIVLIISPICAYFGVSEALSNALAGVIAGVIVLYIVIKNEQHPSDLFSGTEEIGEEEEDGEYDTL